jgi:hypothetical protein
MIIMNGDLKAIVAYFKVLYRHFPGLTNETTIVLHGLAHRECLEEQNVGLYIAWGETKRVGTQRTRPETCCPYRNTHIRSLQFLNC